MQFLFIFQLPVQSGLFYLIYRQRYLRRWSPEIFTGRVVTLAALPAGNGDETESEGKLKKVHCRGQKLLSQMTWFFMLCKMGLRMRAHTSVFALGFVVTFLILVVKILDGAFYNL